MMSLTGKQVKHKQCSEINQVTSRLFSVCIGIPNLNSFQIMKCYIFYKKGHLLKTC